MRIWIVVGLVCLILPRASAAEPRPSTARPSAARPSAAVREDYRRAVQYNENGEYDKALASIEHGLAAAPKDLPLLVLKGRVLFNQHEYAAALAAYQAYLDAGATGANRRDIEQLVDNLRAVPETFLDVALARGSAAIYLDSKSQGLLCTAAPSCRKAVPPGSYKVIAEAPGFERWTGNVTVESRKTIQVAIALVEKPSLLTVRAEPPGARVTVDGAGYDGPAPVAAGPHRIAVAMAGHAAAQREIEAHEGNPVEVDIALAPLTAVQVAPATARLTLDGAPVAPEDGAIAIPSGEHVLIARAPGFQDGRVEIPAVRPADFRISVALARARVVPPPDRFTLRRKIALGVGGLAPVALATGVALGLSARGLDRQASGMCPTVTSCAQASDANDLNRSARRRALEANVAFGVAGGAAIAAAVLWFTGAPERRIAVAPQVGGTTGVAIAGRF